MTEKTDETIYKPPQFSPQLFILISGKRKSGKDYFTDILLNRLGTDNTAVIRISAPIKHNWAEKNALDYEKLLGTSSYKEDHRAQMVEWSSKLREQSYGYWNVEAIKMAKAEGKKIWICTDIRHQKDYFWFLEFYPTQIKRIRVVAENDVRITRGWVFTPGVDDQPTECALDEITDWDLIVNNNGVAEDLEKAVEKILSWVPS